MGSKVYLKRIFERFRPEAASTAVIAVGLFFLFTFAGQTFGLPLLADHCKKTTKSVEVAYNLSRYGDFLHEYNDWKATPQNPRGKQGSIFRYESPLSALLLGGVYNAIDGSNFDVRLKTARIFTLLHLVAAYLLFSIFIFRRNLLSLAVFTFITAASAFTVSYSTKPLAETYALFYQALLMTAATHLLTGETVLFKKAAILAGLTALLCAGGKMNYFLTAFPLMVGYPFLDSRIRGVKGVLHYFAPFVVLAGLGVAALLLFTKFSFYNAFVYMIRGNKPILDDSLWVTFKEGFEYWPTILKRTRTDFGTIVFDWGRYSVFYIAAKFVVIPVVSRKRQKTLDERFTSVLFLLILGHALNYVVLRNLFIPHRYYVVPIYTMLGLSLSVAVGDILRGILFAAKYLSEMNAPKSRWAGRLFAGWQVVRGMSPPFWLAGGFAVAAGVAGYLSFILTSPSHRTTAILAMKGLGHSGLAIEIAAQLDLVGQGLRFARIVCVTLSAAAFVWGVLPRKRLPVTRLRATIDERLRAHGRVVFYLGLVLLLSIPGWEIALQNARSFYEYAASHVEAIEAAEQLSVIRGDTVSGDLVLSWKPCYALYADKCSILEPKEEDVSFYRKNNIHSIMGPVKPFNKYYEKIDKYPPPMTFWKPINAAGDQNKKSSKQKK